MRVGCRPTHQPNTAAASQCSYNDAASKLPHHLTSQYLIILAAITAANLLGEPEELRLIDDQHIDQAYHAVSEQKVVVHRSWVPQDLYTDFVRLSDRLSYRRRL
ncbi:hypothetical protein GGH13_007398, partial [Coemansia sp. S155-1]